MLATTRKTMTIKDFVEKYGEQELEFDGYKAGVLTYRNDLLTIKVQDESYSRPSVMNRLCLELKEKVKDLVEHVKEPVIIWSKGRYTSGYFGEWYQLEEE